MTHGNQHEAFDFGADTPNLDASFDATARSVVFSYEGVAYFGGDGGVSERPLPLAGCASLRAAEGRACVGSRRERSAPFEFPPDAG